MASCGGRETGNRNGFSLIELLIVVAVILIIAAIAIPNLLKSRLAANESSAAATLRAISSGADGYRMAWNNGFPPDLASMGPPPGGGTPSCDGSDQLDAGVACASEPCRRSGYEFSYTGIGAQRAPAPNCSQGGYNNYSVQARPITYQASGVKSYYMDATGLIRVTEQDRAATPADAPL